MKKDKFKEHACEFKNEDDCEEEFDEVDEDLEDAEKEHFEEED
jgi:hypothetical protein